MGVEKPANPEEEPAFKALFVGHELELNPLELDSPPPLKMLPPLLTCWVAPNREGFCVFAPNNEFAGAVLVLLPERSGLEVAGGLLLEPKSSLIAGLEVFEKLCPNVLPAPPLVAGVPKEKVDKGFGGSDMMIKFAGRDERV